MYGISVDSGAAFDIGVLSNLSFFRYIIAGRDYNGLILLLIPKALPNSGEVMVLKFFFNAVSDNNAGMEATREHNGTRTAVN
jgi:hypothetical protein